MENPLCVIEDQPNQKGGFQVSPKIYKTTCRLESDFHRVGPATENDLDQIFIFTLRVIRRSELFDRRCLGFLAGMYKSNLQSCDAHADLLVS